MAHIELIGVPFDGYGRTGNQARAASALRGAGILDVFGTHRVVVNADLDLPAPDSARGPSTGLINEQALLAMTAALNERVGAALAADRFPVVYGGDCSILFGIVTGLRDHARDVGLAVVDGHEDTMPLDVSEDGEAANTEIGLLLGLTGRLLGGPLADRLPALPRERLVVIGPRDEAWRRQFNVGTLADCGVWVAPLASVAGDPGGTARRAHTALTAGADRWWLHIDLDVLDPEEFAAQGLPGVADEPGGLTWAQLAELTRLMVFRGGCIGCSLAIYDPDQDPGATGAAQIVAFVRNVIGGPWI
ncbi:arginase family protein [Mycobacterium sp. NPDC003449]